MEAEQPALTVVLDQATLDIFKIGKSRDARYQLLNCDDHLNFLKKLGKNPADYRPDITHQCLLTLLDSPLNKAGQLRVYIRTSHNVLIEVHSQIRIPRTFPRFAGLMAELLQKLSIRAADSQQKLLNVIKNPLSDHLPVDAKKICFSSDGQLVSLSKYFSNLMESSSTHKDPTSTPKSFTNPIIVFIGAMAHGSDDFDVDAQKISISQYSLSASVACGKLCSTFEDLLDIL